MIQPTIPLIDIGPYRAGDPAGGKRVAEAVGEACERIGFLIIEGHGIPGALAFGRSVLQSFAMLAKLERRETRA